MLAGHMGTIGRFWCGQAVILVANHVGIGDIVVERFAARLFTLAGFKAYSEFTSGAGIFAYFSDHLEALCLSF